MKLYIVRHGDAVTTEQNSKRPLSEEGKAEVKIMANFMRENNIEVSQIYHSGKARAKETAMMLAQPMSNHPKVEELEWIQPDDPIKPIASYSTNWHQDTMLVGHLPFVGKLVSELLFERDDCPCINFPTAGIICLDRIALYQYSIAWFIHPSLLKKI